MKRKILFWTLVMICLAFAVQGALTDDLIAYWPMDNTTEDVVGGNWGVNDGADNSSPICGTGAFRFVDGNTDKITVPHNDTFNFSSSDTFSVCYWVSFDTSNTVYGIMTMGPNDEFYWLFRTRSDGYITQFEGRASDSNTFAITPNYAHASNKNYHVCFTHNTLTNVNAYVNGTKRALAFNVTSAVGSYSNPADLIFGHGWSAGNPASYMDGVIDDVGVWDRVLNQTDIDELFNGGACNPYSNFSSSGGSTDIDFTITDDFNGSSIESFAVNITWANTTEETYSTTNGTVSLVDVGNPGSLDVTYWNMTNYFDRTLTGESITENTTNTIATTTYQAYVCFNASAKVSNASVIANNFTIGSVTRTSCFNITAGTHNVLAKLSGWYDQNQTFTISALSNTTQTVVNMSYANLTIRAIDGTTSESLSGYNLTILSYNYTGWPGESPTGVTNYSFYLINGSYNVTIDHPDYALTTAQANITLAGDQNYTFTLYKSNSVRIYIYDEITGNPILDNITVRWSSNSTTWENVTDTGQLFVSNITADEYELLFYASNYSTRSYTITVGNRTTQILNAYMINSEYSTIFTMKDIDTGDTLDDVSITMYKLINSTWTTVESKTSDISGKAQFFYDPIAHYKFFLSRSDYEDYVFFLNPILFSSYDVFMTKTTVLNYSVDFDDISIIYAPAVFYNNENASFNYLISSPAGMLTDYSITLTYPGGSSTASGVNAIGEQLNAWVNISGATTFDSVVLEYNYTTTLSGERSFKAYLPIVVNETGGTWLQNKNTTYGLGLFERLLIVTIIVLFAVGIATMVGQVIPGLVIGLFLFGFMVFIGFVPIWAILPSMLVGVLFVVWKSGGV